jgi:hypothetical protein
MADEVLGASFRDPSGFLFEHDGAVHRQVNRCCAPHYDRLMDSGLYADLTGRGLLIPHEVVTGVASGRGDPHAVLRPEPLGFVSYPYEWCFSQLKDAALTTLEVQRSALRFGMTLKDASAYNVQFHRGRPVFIDTLSFERYREGVPWVAYRQFCQHFLAPLALMARRDVRLGGLLRLHIDGVPLDLARSLLPARAWLDVQLWLHIRLHARFQARYAADAEAARRVRPVSKRALTNLITALESAVRKLEWAPGGTEWADYAEGDSYTAASHEHKRALVAEFLDALAPREVWDLGANVGDFSRIAADRGIATLAFDVDPACVERNYRRTRERGETRVLPLLLDLANPSPALGWAHRERASLVERRSADVVMALALVHHLAIANNVPLPSVAEFLASLAPGLIVEFVPKSDPKVRILLATREDVFPDYTPAGFEAAFGARFEIEAATPLTDSERTLYRMRRREGRSAGPTSPA